MKNGLNGCDQGLALWSKMNAIVRDLRASGGTLRATGGMVSRDLVATRLVDDLAEWAEAQEAESAPAPGPLVVRTQEEAEAVRCARCKGFPFQRIQVWPFRGSFQDCLCGWDYFAEKGGSDE